MKVSDIDWKASLALPKGEVAVKDEQAERIRENMKLDLDQALQTGNVDMFMDIFEDRDPFEFI